MRNCFLQARKRDAWVGPTHVVFFFSFFSSFSVSDQDGTKTRPLRVELRRMVAGDEIRWWWGWGGGGLEEWSGTAVDRHRC